MERVLWVSLGGAIGSGARYLVSGWALERCGSAFPWGTLVVNALGSFLLGALMQVGRTNPHFSPTVLLTLTVGVMGGFTTYSTFNYETTAYLEQGAWLLAAANVLATLSGCFVAGFLGYALARWAIGA